MNRSIGKTLAASFAFYFLFSGAAFAQTSGVSGADQLQSLINQKNAEMQQVQNQRDALQAQLNVISQSKNSLSSEVSSLNYKINQLDLQQESNRLMVQKLGLEITSMSQDISQAQLDIQNRKAVIAKLFQEMQAQDHQTLLATILGSGGLSESVDKANELSNLQNALLTNISDLKNKQNELSQKIETESQKKSQQEMQRTNIVNTQFILQDQKNEKQTLLAQTQDQERVYQEQIAKLDAQQDSISKVIEGIEDQLRASFDPTLLPIKRPGVLALPVIDAVITQYYGPTKFAERAYRTQFHTGVDFGVPIGTPVYAVADGTITRTDNNDRGTSKWNRYQYGRYILIAHPNNLSSLYAHLSRTVVKSGETVKKGDLIGYSGNSGYATGAHLHLGVYWTPSIQLKPVYPAAGLVPIGVTIDPMAYLAQNDIISQAGSR